MVALDKRVPTYSIRTRILKVDDDNSLPKPRVGSNLFDPNEDTESLAALVYSCDGSDQFQPIRSERGY